MVFAIHWHESAMSVQVSPTLIPPPTSLPSQSLLSWRNLQAWRPALKDQERVRESRDKYLDPANWPAVADQRHLDKVCPTGEFKEFKMYFWHCQIWIFHKNIWIFFFKHRRCQFWWYSHVETIDSNCIFYYVLKFRKFQVECIKAIFPQKPLYWILLNMKNFSNAYNCYSRNYFLVYGEIGQGILYIIAKRVIS